MNRRSCFCAYSTNSTITNWIKAVFCTRKHTFVCTLSILFYYYLDLDIWKAQSSILLQKMFIKFKNWKSFKLNVVPTSTRHHNICSGSICFNSTFILYIYDYTIQTLSILNCQKIRRNTIRCQFIIELKWWFNFFISHAVIHYKVEIVLL